MEHYYKIITKQDVTRSFVVNKKAVLYFFNAALTAHGDEYLIYLKNNEDSYFNPTRLVQHQDTRLLISHKNFDVGDVAYFHAEGGLNFSINIIKGFRAENIKKFLNRSNFYLSTKNLPI
jgi:hypothetical protein